MAPRAVGAIKATTTLSQIGIRESALMLAYSQIEPSLFVLHLCYGIYTLTELSELSSKKQEGQLKKVTAAIMKHLSYYYSSWGYPSAHIAYYSRKIPTYILRAISAAKKKIKTAKAKNIVIDENEEELVEL